MTAYPDRAVAEALVNAFAHRDYFISGSQIDIDIFPDRIEIGSPGKFLLPGNAGEYSLRHVPSVRRNERVCSILEMVRMMENSGTGLEKIADCYEPFGKDFQPEIYSDPAHFVITLRNLSFSKDREAATNKVEPDFEFDPPRSGTRKFDKDILKFCLLGPKSRLEIQALIGRSDCKNFLGSILNPLLDKGLLLTTEESLNAPNQKYYTNTDRIRYIN